MEDYATIIKWKAMKGIFKNKLKGEYLIVAIKDIKKGIVMVIQFFNHVKDDLYVGAIIDYIRSPDEDTLEDVFEDLRYDGNIDILEDKIPATLTFGNPIKIKFKKPSKYIGDSLSLFQDSRLASGYFMIKCKMKKGFEPILQYKLDAGMAGLGDAIKMRAFTSSRIKKITK